jgi:protein gp37
MNEQRPPGGIEWTRIQQNGQTRRGFTWNPVSGCEHGCRWTMPDGTTAVCYAELVATQSPVKSHYPDGFATVQFHPERLREPLAVKEPAGVFLDSMSDLMGSEVRTEHIEKILDVCRATPWHIYQLLTKNAGRLQRFQFPPNVWVGVSSPPDVMHGHALTRGQQEAMLEKSLHVLGRIDVPVRWMSFEPLSWDCAEIVAAYPGTLQWAVIGAASRGRTYYPPEAEAVQRLLDVLDLQGVPVFFKSNLRSLSQAAAAWREAFPAVQAHQYPADLTSVRSADQAGVLTPAPLDQGDQLELYVRPQV